MILIYCDFSLETPLQLLLNGLFPHPPPSPLAPFLTLPVLVTEHSIASKVKYDNRTSKTWPSKREEWDVTLLDLRILLVRVKLVLERIEESDQYQGRRGRN